MNSKLRFLTLSVYFNFVIIFAFYIVSASQATAPHPCSAISPTAPLTEQYTFEPVDAETIVSGLEWSPDGTRLSASYVDVPVTKRSERIRLWELSSGENSILFSRLDEPYAVTGSWSKWSPDGSLLALNSNGTVHIVAVKDGSVITPEDNPIGGARLVWSSDSSQLATIEATYAIRIWNAQTGVQVREIDTNGLVPDLRGVWADQGFRWITQDEEKTIRVWEEGQDEPLFTLSPDYRLSSVWFSPSGNYLASSKLGDNGFVQIWNVNDGQLVQTMNASIIDLIWTSDETCVVTATFNDPKLLRSTKPQIWGAATGELLQTIEAKIEGVGNLAWSPDDISLAYIDEDGTIRIWDISEDG